MQPIVIDQPYQFVPPRDNRFWHGVARAIAPIQLRRTFGVGPIECVGVEKLQASFAAGRGVILAPNHCRPCDPMVIDSLAKAVGSRFSAMASWHLFMGSPVQRFLIRRCGAFSIYREGPDRESLKCAIGIVSEGRRALVLFTEGVVTRSNDRLLDFMDGPSFIARSAAKQRDDGLAVIHPVFMRYFFEGDLSATLTPVLEDLERRLSCPLRGSMPLVDRIARAGDALLGLREREYLGEACQGDLYPRSQRLLEHLLSTLEVKWPAGRAAGATMDRIKQLRAAILREMIQGTVTAEQRDDRWRDLAALYLAQQLYCYVPEDLVDATPERLLETVERMEEDLTDVARPHFPLRAVITVGDAIEVGPERDRSGAVDPVTAAVRSQLEAMLESSRAMRRKSPTGVP